MFLAGTFLAMAWKKEGDTVKLSIMTSAYCSCLLFFYARSAYRNQNRNEEDIHYFSFFKHVISQVSHTVYCMYNVLNNVNSVTLFKPGFTSEFRNCHSNFSLEIYLFLTLLLQLKGRSMFEDLS